MSERLGIENRGTKQANFHVLHGAQMPAVLVELGFVSNSKDDAKLRNSAVQRKMADAIYTSLVQYYQRRKDALAAQAGKSGR